MTPTDIPSDVSTLAKLWQSGAISCAVILAVFYGLSIAKQYVSWLQTGKVAAYVAAAIGVLSACAPSAASGTLPSLQIVVTAALGAVLMLHSPTAVVK
jgi:hypothetical protein